MGIKEPPTTRLYNGQPMHLVVAGLLYRTIDGKYIFTARRADPAGYAGLEFHIHRGESEADALSRGLSQLNLHLESWTQPVVQKLRIRNECTNIPVHQITVLEGIVEGKAGSYPGYASSIGWYYPKEVLELEFEPFWKEVMSGCQIGRIPKNYDVPIIGPNAF